MDMSQKILSVIVIVVIGGTLTSLYLKKRAINKQLNQCSAYTVATIDKVYTSRMMPHAVYNFSISGREFEMDTAVNSFDTGETWSVDMDQLKRRRLFIQVYCDSPAVHQILWDISVPDSLEQPPIDGWKVVPTWAKR